MASDCPYLGSKISLISKAKIRYEGILYTIDTDNATVALSKVRSFGTEKREAERFVAPRDEVYEFIIFRGTDIEDLTVCEPPQTSSLPHDPAIVQSVASQPSGGPASLPHLNAGVFPSSQMPVYNSYMSPNLPIQRPAAQKSTFENSSTPASNLPNAAIGSPAGRATPGSDKSSSKTSNSTSKDQLYSKRTVESSSYNNSNRQQQVSQPKPSQQQSGNSGQRNSSNYDKQQQQHSSYRYDTANSSKNSSDNNPSSPATRTFRGNHHHHRYQQHRSNDDQQIENEPPRNQQQRGVPRRYNNYRGQDSSNYNQNYRGPQRGPRGVRRYTGSRSNHQLTFEGDFDFEESNAQFNKEDIAKELKNKLKISSGGSTRSDKSKTTSEKSQEKGSDATTDTAAGGDNAAATASSGKNDDEKNTTDKVVNGSAGDEQDEKKDDDEVCFYDKSKSFFDHITCETTNPRGERMTWTEERRKNSETFGSAWNPGRNRGMYRGRNYRGRRGGHPGGYRGRGYNNMNSYRGGFNNRGYYNSNYRGNRSQHYHDRGDYQNNNRGGYNNYHNHHNHNQQQYRRYPRKDGDAPPKYKPMSRENNNNNTTTTTTTST